MLSCSVASLLFPPGRFFYKRSGQKLSGTPETCAKKRVEYRPSPIPTSQIPVNNNIPRQFDTSSTSSSRKDEDFLLKLDKLLELDDGVIKGDEFLNDLPAWDSLSVLGFITLIDREFNTILSPADIDNAKKIDDLVVLLGDNIQ